MPSTSSDCPPVPTWSFTQGVLLGQASIIILAALFLKYVVFEDPSVAREEARKRASVRNAKKHRQRPSLSALSPLPSILSSLSYDLSTHAPESLDWLNVLLAQTLTAYRSLINTSTRGDGGARGLMEEMLNRRGNGEENLVDIDRINVGEVEVGEKYPVLSNARVRPSGIEDGVRVELDVDYTDVVSLSISTRLLVNFPRPRFAVLPIALSLSLTHFSGTITLLLPPSSAQTSHPTLHLSLHPDFTLELHTTSLLGSRAKLQDVPKVEQLILARIRGWIQDRVVWPGRVELSLPGLATHPPPPDNDVVPEDGWEWIKDEDTVNVDSFGERVPNAHSDDGYAHEDDEESAVASVDLDADGGPSVTLHPQFRKRPLPTSTSFPRAFNAPLVPPTTLDRPPSPTESLPGHFKYAERKEQERHERERKLGTQENGLRYRYPVGVGGANGPGAGTSPGIGIGATGGVKSATRVY